MTATQSQKPDLAEVVALGFICIAAFALFFINNDFPLYFHADEFKKLEFVLHGTQDFKHPILLLQLARLGNSILGLTDHHQLAVLCRTVSAIAGVMLIVATHVLGRHLVRSPFHWLSTLAVACSPIIVVHAHYFKEDMVFIASAMFAILFYVRMLDGSRNRNILFFAIALGFTLSAQYKSVLLLALFFLFPLVAKNISLPQIYKNLAIVTATGVIIALVINYPGVVDPESLIWGISKESEHVSYGHTLRIYPLPEFFSFHLRNSLFPGMTLSAAIMGLASLAFMILRWGKLSNGIRFLCVYCLVFYFAHEITPMKPAPAFMRYMIPVVPALILLISTAAENLIPRITTETRGKFQCFAGMLVVILVVILPLYKSSMLIYNFDQRDTRNSALQWLKNQDDGGNVYFGKFTLLPNKQSGRVYKLYDTDIEKLRADGFKYVVASSFGYGLYFRGAELDNQIPRVYRAKKRFEYFFGHFPYQEFAPNFKSFAFSNPTLRIFDITAPKDDPQSTQ